MTFAEHPPASDDEREALEFLKQGSRLRGLSPTQLQRVERRLAHPHRSRRRSPLVPVLAALAVALLAGAAVANVVDLSRLPWVGGLFSRLESRPTPKPPRPARPSATPPLTSTATASTSATASAVGAPPVERAERPQSPRPAALGPATFARASRSDSEVGRSLSLASPRGPARTTEPQARAPASAILVPATPGPSAPAARTPAPIAPRAAEDAISAESRSFSAALAEWHGDHDAEAALAALDRHERKFPHGQIGLEAKLLRAEILLRQGREPEALRLLDSVAVSALPRGRELQTVRGELRVKYGRCREGRRDLEHVLAKDRTDALGRRAARAIALCP